jgi:hypothetical protein
MGTCKSKLAPSSRPLGAHNFSATIEPMTHAEIASRRDSIPKLSEAVFGGIKMCYAHVSQRGYCPDGKNNTFAAGTATRI